jgi:aldose 1-epimerase
MTLPGPTVELRASGSDDVRVTIDLHAGGRVAQIDVGGQPLLWAERTRAIGWGAYPMAPWVGRLRHGRFTFGGTEHQLTLNHTDDDGSRHAIHGTVFDATWTLDRADGSSAHLHRALSGAGWPFGGTARQSITLSATSLRCELSVEADDRPFPAAIGWHPWFLKPDRLSFTPTAMHGRGGIGLPTAELVDPAPGPWDDTFRNTEPVRLHYVDRTRAATVTVTSDCGHWVVFDQKPYATCVEPQSGPPDALTMRPEVVTAGSPLCRWMDIGWA